MATRTSDGRQQIEVSVFLRRRRRTKSASNARISSLASYMSEAVASEVIVAADGGGKERER